MSQESQCKKFAKLAIFRQINLFWVKVAKLATLATLAIYYLFGMFFSSEHLQMILQMHIRIYILQDLFELSPQRPITKS